jgi:hypothetical protein
MVGLTAKQDVCPVSMKKITLKPGKRNCDTATLKYNEQIMEAARLTDRTLLHENA